MTKSWFYRMLFSYLPTFFAVTVILLLITYFTLAELSRKSAYNANEMLSHDIAQSIDFSLQGIDQAMMDVITDGKLKAFFNSTDPNMRQYDDIQATLVLKTMLLQNPLIDSIYLYRMQDNRVLTPSSSMAIENFGDKQFIGHEFNSFFTYRWTAERTYRAGTVGDPGTKVVSLVKIAKLLDHSLMVVNVKVDSLSSMIQTRAKSNLNFIELVDAQGAMIASNKSYQAGKANIPSKGNVWTEIRSDYTLWSVRSGSFSHDIWNTASSMVYLSISIGVAVLVLGIAWLLYVTRRNYKPLQSITDRISNYTQGRMQHLQLKDQTDELQYLGKVFDELVDQSHTLSEKNAENLSYRKKQIFLQMIENNNDPQEKEAWMAELHDSGIDSSYIHGYAVAIIEIDHYSEFCERYDRRDQQLLKSIITGVNHEIGVEEHLQIWSEWTKQHELTSLYMFSEADSSEYSSMAVCEKLRDWLVRNTTLTVTIGVGTYQKDVLQISESYHTAAFLLEYKSTLGMNRLISRSDVVDKPQSEWYKQFNDIEHTCRLFRTGDPQWVQAYQQVFQHFVDQLLTRNELITVLQFFLTQLQREMNELSVEFQEIWNKESDRLYSLLKNKDMFNEIKDSLLNMLRNIFEQISELRQNRAVNPLISRIKELINAEYSNPDLSLVLISSQLGLSSSYVSRLFKESFGVKFVDYVTQIRMEKAIATLKLREEITIQETAVSVGYMNTLTFIRAFKKHSGTTPGQYRKDHQ